MAPTEPNQAAAGDAVTEQQRQEAEAATEALFSNIDPTQQATEIESYCINCGKNGTTRLLLTRIPHFREVIIMAFECPHCHFRNSEIQAAGAIQEKGCVYTCHVKDANDLNRQIVRSEWATVSIPALEFEVPPTHEHGSLTTVEGFVTNCINDLELHQPARKLVDPETHDKIEAFIARLRGLLDLTQPFDVILDDPSGNSYIENLHLPRTDPQLHLKLYVRTIDQDRQLGLAPPPEVELPSQDPAPLDESIMVFPGLCSHCGAPVECKMHPIDIPYFREVIIMAMACERCGYRTSEVKSGGAISPKGRRIELKLADAEDVTRDVLKSDSCSIIIPELDLELGSGILGSKFTTIEGLIDETCRAIKENPFLSGDSARDRPAFDAFVERLQQFGRGEILGTFIMDDPLGTSYLQNLYAPDPDPNMKVIEYERTWEQNEEYGLNDIQTENYSSNHTDDAVASNSGSA